MNLIEKAIEIVRDQHGKNGFTVISQACNVSYRTVAVWKKNGKLPYTELTGKTNYSGTIAKLTRSKVTRAALLRGVKAIPKQRT